MASSAPWSHCCVAEASRRDRLSDMLTEWLISAPLWIQTPLVMLLALIATSALGYGLYRVSPIEHDIRRAEEQENEQR